MPTFTGLRAASRRSSAAARGASAKRDTRCELLLRRALTRRGLRYRLDAADLPGRPDIVFRGAKVVVFCDGDYWHGRDLERRLERLASGHNPKYWVEKIRSNVARDSQRTRELTEMGWLVLRFWEMDIKSGATEIACKVETAVRHRFAEATRGSLPGEREPRDPCLYLGAPNGPRRGDGTS